MQSTELSKNAPARPAVPDTLSTGSTTDLERRCLAHYPLDTIGRCKVPRATHPGRRLAIDLFARQRLYNNTARGPGQTPRAIFFAEICRDRSATHRSLSALQVHMHGLGRSTRANHRPDRANVRDLRLAQWKKPRPRRSRRGRGSWSRRCSRSELGLDDLAVQQGDDGPEATLEDQAAGGEAQPGGQDAVVGAGRPAALEVAQDDAAASRARSASRWRRRRAMPIPPRRGLPKGSGRSSMVKGPRSGNLAPSATTTIPYFLPAARRLDRTPSRWGRSMGTSGTRM